LEAIARTVENGEQFAALTANVTAMAEMLTTLTATVEQLTTAANTATAETNRRLQALEVDEDAKRREWQEDLPAKNTLRVTHRAPGRGNPLGQPALPEAPQTLADVAEENLKKIPQLY
jgi:hypothetical protein